MDQPSKCDLLFPGEDRWELWRTASDGSQKLLSVMEPDQLGFQGAEPSRVLALPAACAYAIPAWVFAKDEQELRSAVELQLEKEGLHRPEEPAGFDFEALDRQDRRVLVRMDALAKYDLPFASHSAAPTEIFVAPRLLPLPDGQIVIWKELGRFVAAVAKDGKVFYYNMITAARIDGKAVDEVLRWTRQFAFQGMLSPCDGITLWTTDADVEAVEERSGLPVEVTGRPVPRYAGSMRGRLVPSGVQQLREKESRRLRLRLGLVSLAWLAVIAIAGFAVAWTLAAARHGQLLSAIEQLSPSASDIQGIRQRWSEVAPSVEADRSPLESMLLIHGLPSAPEVSLTRFELNGERLALQGRATSPAEALKFLGAISQSKELAAYRWTYPQPLIDRDGAATFEIEGVIPEEETAP